MQGDRRRRRAVQLEIPQSQKPVIPSMPIAVHRGGRPGRLRAGKVYSGYALPVPLPVIPSMPIAVHRGGKPERLHKGAVYPALGTVINYISPPVIPSMPITVHRGFRPHRLRPGRIFSIPYFNYSHGPIVDFPDPRQGSILYPDSDPLGIDPRMGSILSPDSDPAGVDPRQGSILSPDSDPDAVDPRQGGVIN